MLHGTNVKRSNRMCQDHLNIWHYEIIQGDSLARGPKLWSIKNYVSQLTDDELTAGYYQQDGATCHTSNARNWKFFLQDRIISKKPLATQISRCNACRLLSLGAYWRAKCTKIHPGTVEQLKDAIRQEIQAVNVDTLGNVFQNLEKRI